MPIVLDLNPHYTYEDYRQWEGRWELIKGTPYSMTPQPSIPHQIISGNIHRQLGEKFGPHSQCVALLPVDWCISENTVVQPDNMVVCGADLQAARLIQPPVIIFEILSAATKKLDRIIKFQLYKEAGVRYFILVEPFGSFAEAYELKNGAYVLQGELKNETFTFNLPTGDLSFDFSTIWPA